MTPQDLRSNLAKIKENQDRLFACKRHNFGDCPTPYHFGQTFVCLNCQGSMKAVDAFRYIQGYEAAGRNPNDILSGYREDWKPQPSAWDAVKGNHDLDALVSKAADIDAMEQSAPKVETFEEAWKAFEAQGFRYGRDALEQVRFGWNIAKGLRTAS